MTEAGKDSSRAPWWDSGRLADRRPYLEGRARLTAAVRQFFAERGFVEVETPALQVSPGLEVHLKAFATEIEDPSNVARRTLYLHTSPEFAMKKLLAAGVPRLYQLARVFRNAERSAIHHPEFTMLEWYRAQAGYRDLMSDCEEMLCAALGAVADRNTLTWNGRDCDPRAEWEYLSVAQAFERHAGIDLMATAAVPHRPQARLLAAEAARINIAANADDGWEDLFFKIFLSRIEPHLGIGAPTILYDYPVSMAALAREKPGDPRLAERFELYVAGLELANGFSELTDAAEQSRRFETERARKSDLYGETYPIDEDFLAALAQCPDSCAGIALGFDRLVMLATGAARIEDVLWAPVA